MDKTDENPCPPGCYILVRRDKETKSGWQPHRLSEDADSCGGTAGVGDEQSGEQGRSDRFEEGGPCGLPGEGDF